MTDSPGHLEIREAWVPSGSARLYVREVGRGLPVVVLHGGPEFDHRYLVPELDVLADGSRLVYYDQRGRGRSFTGTRSDDVTIDSEVDDLDRIRAWIGSGRMAVLGHSWGGVLAAEYAVRHPDRVSHLVFMNTAPLSYADKLFFQDALTKSRTPEERERMRALKADPAYQRGDADADLAYLRIHFRPAVPRPEFVDVIVRRMRAFSPEGVVAARRIDRALDAGTWARADYDLLQPLAKLGIPTLVLHGELDCVPVEIARRIALAIPHARLVTIPDCGHFTYFEEPERTRTAITEFLMA